LLLAAIDFNQRFSRTTPSVAEQTKGCDFYMSLGITELTEFYSDLSPAAEWSQDVMDAVTMRPIGIVGAYSDKWVTFLAQLSGGVSRAAAPYPFTQLNHSGTTVNEDAIPLVSPYSVFEDHLSDKER
jgi:hypothetical protein